MTVSPVLSTLASSSCLVDVGCQWCCFGEPFLSLRWAESKNQVALYRNAVGWCTLHVFVHGKWDRFNSVDRYTSEYHPSLQLFVLLCLVYSCIFKIYLLIYSLLCSSSLLFRTFLYQIDCLSCSPAPKLMWYLMSHPLNGNIKQLATWSVACKVHGALWVCYACVHLLVRVVLVGSSLCSHVSHVVE